MGMPIFLLMMCFAGSGAETETLFLDIAAESGLDFTHFNGMTGGWHLPEITGQGGALFDYDGDGDLDVYLVQGALMPGKSMADAWFPLKGREPPRDRLFRNDLTVAADGTRRLTFVDVTEQSGLDARGYGMGVAVGDIDNDGWPDLYVTNLGPNQLWRNRGDGTFENITAKSGTADPGWSTSASFFDYDRDGLLDLYVANYALFDPANDPECYTANSARDYCGPDAYKAAGDRLYRNRGDGVFEDATSSLRGADQPGAGLGAVAADFNGDGWLDMYVANDGDPNSLFINLKNGSFENQAMFSGAAVNGLGSAEASMGVAAGDFDRDGDEDLFMTHLMGETNTLYVNDGSAFFEDRTNPSGLAAPSRRFTAFGTYWIDVDNDGWLDLFIANGAVKREENAAPDDKLPLKQPNQLFLSREGRKFVEAGARAGASFGVPEVSRGAAFGDVDNDGDLDILLCNNNGPVRLLRNQTGNRNHWLGLRLVEGKRDALGARIKLTPAEGKPIWDRVKTDGSYCSANDPRALIGLGSVAKIKELVVIWPDGKRQEATPPAVDRYIEIVRSK